MHDTARVQNTGLCHTDLRKSVNLLRPVFDPLRFDTMGCNIKFEFLLVSECLDCTSSWKLKFAKHVIALSCCMFCALRIGSMRHAYEPARIQLRSSICLECGDVMALLAFRFDRALFQQRLHTGHCSRYGVVQFAAFTADVLSFHFLSVSISDHLRHGIRSLTHVCRHV